MPTEPIGSEQPEPKPEADGRDSDGNGGSVDLDFRAEWGAIRLAFSLVGRRLRNPTLWLILGFVFLAAVIWLMVSAANGGAGWLF